MYNMKTVTSLKNIEGNIQGFILSIVGVAVVLAVGLIVLQNLSIAAGNTGVLNCNNASWPTLNGTLCANVTSSPVSASVSTSIAGNSSDAIITQLGTVPQWVGIIITVALAFIVLGYFYNRM